MIIVILIVMVIGTDVAITKTAKWRQGVVNRIVCNWIALSLSVKFGPVDGDMKSVSPFARIFFVPVLIFLCI